ncbi:Ig-like domain-containing protein, partial [Tenacibaculum sp. 190524A05c]|uniref:Ig-like domain-containing protein n=1 Tax=Tenacibaculum platacis TaxID=3137852 RepID=UPI0032B24CB0
MSFTQVFSQIAIDDPDQNVSSTVTFTDSGGVAGDYGFDENESITLTSASGSQLVVQFNSFSVEQFLGTCFDQLSIYDGADDTAPLIGDFCDISPPTIGEYFTSTGSQLHFVFTSDNIINQAGWEAIIYTSPADPTFPNTDGDALDNSADADDDNDGILDLIELGTCTPSGTSVDWSTFYTSGDSAGSTLLNVGDDPLTSPTLTSSNNVGITIQRELTGDFPNQQYRINDFYGAVGGGNYTLLQSSIASGSGESRHTFTFDEPVYNLGFTIFDVDTGPNFTDSIDVIFTLADGSTHTLDPSEYTDSGQTVTGNNIVGTGTDTDFVIDGIQQWVIKFELRYRNIGATPSANQGLALSDLSFCTALDTDGDGTPDYLDVDSDNDGCFDALEGGGSITTAQVNGSGQITGGQNGSGIPTLAGSGQAVGSSTDFNTLGSQCDSDGDGVPDVSDQCNGYDDNADQDGDGVPDRCDSDNDNDGIIDSVEGLNCSTGPINSGTTGSSVVAGLINDIFTQDGVNVDVTTTVTGSTLTQLQAEGTTGLRVQGTSVDDGAGDSIVYTFTFSEPVSNVEFRWSGIDQGDKVTISSTGPSGANNIFIGPFMDPISTIPNSDYDDKNAGDPNINGLLYSLTGNNTTSATITSFTNGGDATRSYTDVSINGLVSSFQITTRKERQDGDVANNGNVTFVFDNFEYCTVDDTDNDGTPNHLDLDSDDDGCFDSLEGGEGILATQINGSGVINGSVDGSGIPDLATSGQPIGTAIDATATDAQCDDDDDGVLNGSDVCNGFDDSVDADSDGVPDACDLDDDNDGILDTVELASCANSISFEYYDGTPSGLTVDNIPTTGADATGTFGSTDVDALIASIFQVNDTYGIRFTGYFNIPTEGNYNFYLSSDDGSKLFIDDVEVIDNDGDHGVVTVSERKYLSPGLHKFVILFYENIGSESVVLEYELPGTITRQQIPFTSMFCALDTDGDGTPNHLDGDSDGDGCSDANEQYNDTNADGGDGDQFGSGDPSSVDGSGQVTETGVDYALALNSNVTDNTADLCGTPDAVDDSAITNEDSSISITVSTNDSIGDDGGDGEDYSLTSGPSNGAVTESSDGVFVYTPDPNFSGVDTFTYTITDADGDTDVATVTITVVPDTDEDGIVDTSDLDDDNDGILDSEECTVVDIPAFSISSGASNTFNVTSANGVVLDISSIDNSFNIEINGVSVVPNQIQFSNSAFVAGQSLARFASDNTAYGEGGNANVWDLNWMNADPSFLQLKLIVDELGNVSLKGRRSTSSPLEEMIIDSSHPQFNQINWNTGGPNTITVSQIAIGPTFLYGDPFGLSCPDTDGDGTPNYLDLDSDNDGCDDVRESGGTDGDSNGVLDGTGFDGSGLVTGGIGGYDGLTAADDEILPTTVVVDATALVNQNTVDGDSATFTITSANATTTSTYTGTAPTTTPDYTTGTDTSSGINYQWYIGDPSSGGIAISPADSNYSGESSSTLTVNDVTGLDGTVYYLLVTHDNNVCTEIVNNVTLNVDSAPDAVDDTATVNEDASTTITVSTNDDIGGDGGDGEDYSLTSGPSNGTVTETSDGVFVYTPNADFNGTDSFTYTITDADGDTDTATVVITV